ncbi:porin family protein [Bdellovibrio bacteriovorus]|uniref:porin family protein n=1 Tax=Bdellovibrio bacteriovorus TaxID=959 RepID=UPI0021CFFFA9|nr:porin family protein [Bdellovibrio bacteriovorus]UXR64959.1 porin family protein [Bdellovibrio bacteriovorus]
MRIWHKHFVVVLAVLAFHSAWAQEESAPQEPPFVQEESEFEVPPPSDDLFSNEADAIESEIQSAAPEGKKETVNLNEQNPGDAKVEEDLLFEEEAAPVVEENTPVVEEPAYEVAPARQTPKVDVVRRSKSGGVEYIQHPQAAKGLMTITKDGAYVYRVKPPSASKESGTFRVGMIDPPKIQSADGVTDYSSMYGGSSQPVFMFDYEWKPFNGFGSLGVQIGVGVMYSTGQGRFIVPDPQFPDQQAKEEYTFLAIPLSLGGIYRLEWGNRQWVAPYVAAGGTYIGIAEIRDDGKSPSLVGTPGVYGAGGLLFNISAMNRDTAFTLSSEYGIKNLWVSLEYRQLQTFTEDVDFSSGIVGAGVTVDY